MDPQTQSRLYKTSLGGFDQLVALGEKYINTSFSTMYKISDPDSPLRSFRIGLRGLGTLSGTLHPPEVQLIVDGTDFSSLKYYLKFQSGTLDTFVSEDPDDDTKVQYDVSGWVCVFKIAISNAIIPQGSTEFNSLKARVSYGGEFTLAKLWLDSTKASMSDQSLQAESSYGKYDWSAQPAGVQANWKSFVSKWINNADVAGKTLLGLTVIPTNPLENATFPPTYLSKQTYPYFDPAKTPTPPAKNGDPQNMLLYLMMAKHRTPPSPVLLPPNSGMWIDNSHQIKGTFAMSSHLFWEQWLLPLLGDFNRQTQFYTEKPTVHVADDVATILAFWNIGLNPQPASYFDFKPLATGSSSLGYEWGPYSFDVSAADQQGSNLPHGTFRAVAQHTGKNHSIITFVPGSQEITLSGSGDASLKIDYQGSNTPAWPTYEKITFNLEWSLTLQIVSIDTTGGVQVQIKNYDPSKPYHKLTWNDDASTLRGTLITMQTPQYASLVNQRLEERFRVVFAGLQQRLQAKLRNQNKLYLPGAGAFFFKNGTFNEHGDFMAQVLYNGTDAPANADTFTAAAAAAPSAVHDIATAQAAAAVKSAEAAAKTAQAKANMLAAAAADTTADATSAVISPAVVEIAKAEAKLAAAHAASLAASFAAAMDAVPKS